MESHLVEIAGEEVPNKEGNVSNLEFFKAVQVWIEKPHVVNRRACGAKILCSFIGTVDDGLQMMQCRSILAKELIPLCETGYKDPKSLENILNNVCNMETESERIDGQPCQKVSKIIRNAVEVVFRDILPRQRDRHPYTREMIIIDREKNSVTFVPLLTKQDDDFTSSTDICYKFALQQLDSKTSVTLSVYKEQSESDRATSHSISWLRDHLLPKIVKWMQDTEPRHSISSLSLIPIDKYNALYQDLKVKYGHEIVKIWPEKTDPQKFVFEDVAIATYLLILWEDDRQKKGLTKKQSFVDLGCGNGLLVYILASEGHPGLGIDIRKRKIWDLYGEHIKLKEASITPSDCNLYPEYDWLIGNHSDELTPWIPVMAARSSFDTCYFVLPCCHHDFDSKFSGRVEGSSQYRTYLDFVQEVGRVCGFHVEEDTLRIPSTKRVCFIGRSRIYSQDKENEIDQARTDYINRRCKQTKNVQSSCDQINASSESWGRETSKCENNQAENTSSSSQWASEFQPRERVESVRNCTKLDKSVTDHIIQTVFETIIEETDACWKTTIDERQWNKGGSLPLPEVAALFDSTILQQLKKECGGLQTLLRNRHEIFQVSKGCVQLRDWTLADPMSDKHKKKGSKNTTEKQKYIKTKLCWFYNNHPNGCPRTAEMCQYAHGVHEIRVVNENISEQKLN